MVSKGQLACLAIAFALTACGHHRSSRNRRVHTVIQGDTLTAIAKKHGVDLDALIRANALSSAHRLFIGQELSIPRQDEIFRPAEPREAPLKRIQVSNRKLLKKMKEPKWSSSKEKVPYLWPVDGVVTALHGQKDGMRQDGVMIAARVNTVVWACADGKVLYAGQQSGYGNIIILKHSDDIVTIYAHNDSHLVKEGQTVKQGQPIAWVGRSGGAASPGLHFEIRKGKKSLNPLRYLP